MRSNLRVRTSKWGILSRIIVLELIPALLRSLDYLIHRALERVRVSRNGCLDALAWHRSPITIFHIRYTDTWLRTSRANATAHESSLSRWKIAYHRYVDEATISRSILRGRFASNVGKRNSSSYFPRESAPEYRDDSYASRTLPTRTLGRFRERESLQCLSKLGCT